MDGAVSIVGLGLALPTHRIDRESAAEYASTVSCSEPGQAKKLKAIYRRSGIEQRGSVLLERLPESDRLGQSFYPPARSPEDRGPTTARRSDRYAEDAPALARAAARAALADGRVASQEITHLVTVSCTGFHAPGFDITLIDDLGLSPRTQRVQVGFMGCHGAINGLRAAAGLTALHRQAKVLVCSVELCSLHYQYGFNANRIVSGAIFADGAGALVVAPGPNNGDTTPRLVATGSYLVPKSRDAMTWRIGDHGYEMTLSASLPSLIEAHLGPFLVDWLHAHGESVGSIGGWAVHPGGARIITAVESAMGLAPEQLHTSRRVLAEHGNMSSATMPIILERFATAGQPRPWLMLGFGPGLEIEVALIR